MRIITDLKEFTSLYPNTNLAITCTSSAEAYPMIEECSIDVSFHDETLSYVQSRKYIVIGGSTAYRLWYHADHVIIQSGRFQHNRT